MNDRHALPAAAHRHCGVCDTCCVVLPIPAVDKPAGVRCRHLVKGPGCCGIYHDRPQDCAVYGCAWLDGYLPTDFRPDRSGLLLEVGWIEHPRDLVILSGGETRPGALAACEKRLDAWLPAGCVATIDLFDKSDATVYGAEEDLAAFVEFLAGCHAVGGITRRMADGDQFVPMGDLYQLPTIQSDN